MVGVHVSDNPRVGTPSSGSSFILVLSMGRFDEVAIVNEVHKRRVCLQVRDKP